MQFSQPPYQPTGFLNYGQPCGFNAPTLINGYPDIIGEGNVVSVTSPDGSAQLLFLPYIQWPQWRTLPQNPYFTHPINTLGAWFVRNIFNPIQPTVFSQLDCFSLQHPRASASDCCFDLSPPVLPLKFHNDMCTSTTDIHYFIPKQFNWSQRSAGCAVQVACPVATTSTSCDYELSCTKPCNCTPAEHCSCVVKDKKEKQNIKCKCIKIKKSYSQMSIDSTSTRCSRCKEKPRRKSNMKSKKTSQKCECKKPLGSDKSVTTYAEQGIGCAPDKGEKTQTSCSGAPITQASKEACNSMCYRAQTWSPVPFTSRRAMSPSTVYSRRESNFSESSSSCSSCCTSGRD